ncbi:MAG: site-2 protease family protein [Acidimicrobiales bacterium]
MTPWGPQGSGAGRRRGFRISNRDLIIVGVAVVLVALIVRSHRISGGQLIYFCVLVPSIVLHEISHGAVALALGDKTAKQAGRLNLNPIRHIDPVGTLLVPAILTLSGFGAYGWAKPVPVNARNLRDPRNHIVLVSLVGPLTNFALAALSGVCFVAVGGRTTVLSGAPLSLIEQIFFYAGFANIVLGVFNLIPCPPLDGAAVLERFIPSRHLPQYYELQPFLMFLPFILILLFHSAWSDLINHALTWWENRLI